MLKKTLRTSDYLENQQILEKKVSASLSLSKVAKNIHIFKDVAWKCKFGRKTKNSETMKLYAWNKATKMEKKKRNGTGMEQ